MLNGRALREAVERAQDVRRFDPEDIRSTLARIPRRSGTRQLADLLALMQPDRDSARSHLERLLLPLTRRARLPRPDVNREIAGHKRDFVWPEQRLVVEVDGHRYHSSRQAGRRDNRRDRQPTALGWRPVRFTYEEVAFEPTEIQTELAGLCG
jgi:very-short-patch-repair endonuclease